MNIQTIGLPPIDRKIKDFLNLKDLINPKKVHLKEHIDNP